MSDPKQKEKPKKFLLPSALKHMQQHYRNQTQSFVKNLGNAEEQRPHAKREQKQHSLFKLNPSSTALVSEVPVDTLRKRSKSQKLESLQSEPPNEAFFLLDHHKQAQEKKMVERKPIAKNYNIDIRQMVTAENRFATSQEMQEEEPEKYEIVRPSQPYTVSKPQGAIFHPTIVQTPILPCFSSEFGKRQQEPTKTVQEGEGVWKIGRIKVKGKRCELRIGEFVFEGEQVRGEGRAGLLAEDSLHALPNWKDMWILQPHESLFASD